MKIVGIIPARLASSRFPNKPMTDILGIPMIGHVFFRTKFCKKLTDVYVATCDIEIKKYIESIGGKVIMTSDMHERASERTAEAVSIIETSTGESIDYVVMIQGDLPLIMPEMIDEIISPLKLESNLKIVDMISKISDTQEFESPNNVKVVMDLNEYAIYYSREPIPSRKKFNSNVPMWRQPGLIMFEKRTLLEYVKMKSTPLEIIESVDMNRLIEYGYKIKFVKTNYPDYFCSIDVLTDKENVLSRMENDKYFERYKYNN
ncbi:MAG: 3-deoxy-manno-octulosonate cytidylyltransferase [Bacteroidota bacterium]